MTDKPDGAQESGSAEHGQTSTGRAILRGMFGLGLFAIITAGLIALTQLQTRERIIEQVKLAQSRALFEIVPLSEHDNDLLADAYWIEAKQLGLKSPREAYLAKQGGQVTTLILPVVAPNGYTAPIELIVGINSRGVLEGVRVVQHKETPGLGDKIETRKSDWIRAFTGKSLANTPDEQWAVKKDGGVFDQLTGATITPRAIVSAVHEALKFYQSNRESLLQQAAGSAFQQEVSDGDA